MKKLLLALALCSPLMILSQAMAVQPLGTDVKLAFEVEEPKLLPPKLDILFVIDDSASMSVMQNQLAAAMNRLSGTFDNLNADIHAAVTTSTMTELDGPGCKFSATKACDGRFNKGFLSNSEPNFSAELAERLLVGTLGGGTEAFFEPVLLALQTPLRHPENAGFLRSDAKLVVVMLTDADDQSKRTASEFALSLVALKNGDTSLVHLITSTVPLGENTRSCSRNGEPVAFKIDEAAKLLNA
ncbi:MAG: VWA domain-containing protein, partial [Proteobacteria bacterium]